MPARVPQKIEFLKMEIRSLRARIGSAGNAAQLAKEDMLEDICADYEKSAEAAAARQGGAA